MSGAIAPLSGHPCYLCACADLARCCVSVLRIVTKPLQWARAIEGVQALGGSALARAHFDKVRTLLPRQPMPPATIPQDTQLTGAVLHACAGGLHLRARRVRGL